MGVGEKKTGLGLMAVKSAQGEGSLYYSLSMYI